MPKVHLSHRAAAPWLVLGYPDSKRVRGIQSACLRLGRPLARVLSWGDWLTSPDLLFCELNRCDVFKIEPPGEDPRVHERLRRWGASQLGASPPSPLAYGELGSDEHWFEGFSLAMKALSNQLSLVSGVLVLNEPEDILAMTDKWQCQDRLHQFGLATPDRLGLVSGYEAFMALLDDCGSDRVMLKARYGSSAAGVLAFRRGRSDQLQATTSADVRGSGATARVYNTKRLRTYTQAAQISQVVDLIARQGAYVEQWVTKPRCGSGHFDVRLLTLAGVAQHRVARIGQRTLTNLHLDAQRAAPTSLLDNSAINSMEQVAQQATRCFPASRIIGWDLVVRPGGDVKILEANAFGDLLPGLLWNGVDAYAAAYLMTSEQ